MENFFVSGSVRRRVTVWPDGWLTVELLAEYIKSPRTGSPNQLQTKKPNYVKSPLADDKG